MPTIRKKGHSGIIIVSRRRGRFITHQITPEGQRLLQSRFGILDEKEIDVSTLINLVEEGHAYTKRQLRRARRAQDQDFFEPPREVPPPRVTQVTAPPAAPKVVVCPTCAHGVLVGAHFCGQCGQPMGAEARSQLPLRTSPSNPYQLFLVLAVVAAVIAAVVVVLKYH